MKSDNTIESGFSLALDTIQGWVSGFYILLPNIIAGLIFLLIFIFTSLGVRSAVKEYFNRRERTDLGVILSGFAFWIMITFGGLVFLTIVIPSLRPVDLLSSLGIGSIAFGFAFKDILQNWLAGLLILLRLPFRRGDQIRIGEAEGTVQRIEPRATIIRTYDGRDIIVPNINIYAGIVTIHTSQELRRVQIDFTVGYAYDIRKITEIILNAFKPIDEIIPDPPPQILCWELGATSLGVRVRWWINSERSQEVISRARIIQAIKEAFDANDIDPTDPQLIYYQRANQVDEIAMFPENENPTSEKNKEVQKSYGPPPEVIISKNDPESGRPKLDSKKRTMLPET